MEPGITGLIGVTAVGLVILIIWIISEFYRASIAKKQLAKPVALINGVPDYLVSDTTQLSEYKDINAAEKGKAQGVGASAAGTGAGAGSSSSKLEKPKSSN
eukprot:jgi/Hompol1/1190/HPOL_005539-RA